MLTQSTKKEFSNWVEKNRKLIWNAIDGQKDLWEDTPEILFELNGEDSDSTWAYNGVDYIINVEVKLIDFDSGTRSFTLYLDNGDIDFDSGITLNR